MKLWAKTFIILFGAIAIMVGFNFAWSRMILLRGFSQVESDTVLRDVAQVNDTLQNDLAMLEARTADYAYWNDTYQYIINKDQKFIDTNFRNEHFSVYMKSVDCVAFFHNETGLVFSKGYDHEKNVEKTFPEGLLRFLNKDNPILKHENEQVKFSGLVLTDDGPFLLASLPVLNSDMKGPIHGVLVFAETLDNMRVLDLAKTLRTSLTLFRMDDPALPPDVQTARQSINDLSPVSVHPYNQSQIAGYAILKDIQQKPILILRLDKPRSIYDKGWQTLYYLVLYVLATGLVMGILTLFLFSKTVLAPLAQLIRSLRTIELSADLSRRVCIKGHDELAELGSSINHMLESLEKAEKTVRTSEMRLRNIVEFAGEGIITIDESGAIQSFNSAAEQIFGFSEDEVRGINVFTLMPEPYRTHHGAYIQSYLNSGESKMLSKGRDILGQKKDGTIFPIYITLSEVNIEGQRLFTAIIRDITERKRYEEYLTLAATQDALTGLMNRRFFEEQVDVAMNSAKRYGHALSLCMCDIDKFKSINDQYGHAAGDAVLKQLGKLIGESIRKEDIGGRFGGDEFSICFTHTPSVEAMICLDRIRKQFSSHIFCQDTDHPFIVTASFGLADLPTHETDIKTLYAAADRSLYQAKQLGRNRIACNAVEEA